MDYWTLHKIDMFLERPIELQLQPKLSKMQAEEGVESYEYEISKHIRNLSRFLGKDYTYVQDVS